MDFKKTNAPSTTVTRNLMDFCRDTNTLEDGFEGEEQIQIARYYERLPKPTLISTQEFLEDRIYFRNPAKETER